MSLNRYKLFFLFLMFLAGVIGCSGPRPELRQPSVDLVWPSGDETPRIRYLTSIYGPEDLQITQNAILRFWDYMVGRERSRLVAPYGVFATDADKLYIVDTFNQNIQLFDAADGRFVVFPDEEHPMLSPINIAVNDETGRIYVSDSKAAVIRLFDDPADIGSSELGRGLLKRPTGLAINRKTEELLVVDTKLFTVFRFDLHSHALKGKFGSKGVNSGQFNHPTNICVAPDGSIIVTDALNFRVQAFSAEGEFLRTFGRAGDSPGHFARPRGVATDSEGNIYVVDALFDNIQIFSKEGQLLLAFGTSGTGYGEFWLPAGIFIDKNDKIYIADLYNKRVQIFQYLKQEDVVQ